MCPWKMSLAVCLDRPNSDRITAILSKTSSPMWRRKTIAAAVKWSVTACRHPLGDERLRLFLAQLLWKGKYNQLTRQANSTTMRSITLLQHATLAPRLLSPWPKCCWSGMLNMQTPWQRVTLASLARTLSSAYLLAHLPCVVGFRT